MLIQRDNRAWVQISRALITGRSDDDEGEVPPNGVLSWRSYLPGFRSSHKALVSGWYDLLRASCREKTHTRSEDFHVTALGDIHPGFKF